MSMPIILKKVMITILAVSAGAMGTDTGDGGCTGQHEKSDQCVPKVHKDSEDGEGLSLFQQSVLIQKSRKEEKKDLDHLMEEDEDDDVAPKGEENKNDEEVLKEIESLGEPDGVVDLGDNSSLIQADLGSCGSGEKYWIQISFCYVPPFTTGGKPKYCKSAAIGEKLYTVSPAPVQNFKQSNVNGQQVKLCYTSDPGSVAFRMPTGTQGKDAAWMDWVRIHNNGVSKQWGQRGGHGWCLSTDKDDAGYWKREGYMSNTDCWRGFEFNFNRGEHQSLKGWHAMGPTVAGFDFPIDVD